MRNKPIRHVHVSTSTTTGGLYCLYNCVLKIEKTKPRPLLLGKFSRGRVLGLLGLEAGLLSYPLQPDNCPTDFRISQLRFAKSLLRFDMGQVSVWNPRGTVFTIKKRGEKWKANRARAGMREEKRKEGKDPEGGNKKCKEVSKDK